MPNTLPSSGPPPEHQRSTYGTESNWGVEAADHPAPVETLLENHRAFLRYLERRVGDRALAEDILQDAFAKVVARPEQAPADEAIVPWFYRTLRNAAVDSFGGVALLTAHTRRSRASLKPTKRPGRDGDGDLRVRVSPGCDVEAGICGGAQAIEVAGTPVKAYAEQKGLSSSNAGVRVFRAREALKKRVTESCGTCAEHGCLNCTCKRA